MAFPRRLLIEGEELVVDMRPHWIALVVPVLVTVLVVVGWILALANAPDDGTARTAVVWGSSILAALILIWFVLRRVIAWATSTFAVTSDRVIHRLGLIAKSTMEIPLEAINDVRFHQSIFERVIGAGDLVIQSASQAGRQVFSDIRDPEGVQKTIYELGEANKQRMYQGTGPAPGAPSVTTELQRLVDLRDRGVVTQAEFEEQKRKILGG